MRKTLFVLPVFLFVGGAVCAANLATTTNQPKSNRVNIVIPMGKATNQTQMQTKKMTQTKAGQKKSPTIVIKTK